MGDRTTVSLTILLAHNELAKSLFDNEPNESDEEGEFATYTFYEVNYGNLECLQELAAAGIPYESTWSSGSEFAAGTEYLRFNTDGKPELKQVYDDGTNPNLDLLLQAIADHQELIKIIRAKQEEITSLPWEGQLENSRIYLTSKLIDPSFGSN